MVQVHDAVAADAAGGAVADHGVVHGPRRRRCHVHPAGWAAPTGPAAPAGFPAKAAGTIAYSPCDSWLCRAALVLRQADTPKPLVVGREGGLHGMQALTSWAYRSRRASGETRRRSMARLARVLHRCAPRPCNVVLSRAKVQNTQRAADSNLAGLQLTSAAERRDDRSLVAGAFVGGCYGICVKPLVKFGRAM